MFVNCRSLRSLLVLASVLATLTIALVLGTQWEAKAQSVNPSGAAQPDGLTMENLPPGVGVQTLLSNLNAPMAMAFDPEGKIFYTEKSGAVRLINENGLLQTTHVKDFTVDYQNSERGLLGIALDPNFSSNHFIYVYYTEWPGSAGGATWNKVVRFTESNGVAVPGSDVELFKSRQTAPNHVGGNIHFGPDGKLYISIGDNASPGNSQNLNVTQGKMHRINPDPNNLVPSDNPVFTQTGTITTTYAIGLRNSFDFTFDPASGNMFASENGPSCDDELNRIEAGFNYGWRGTCEDNDPSPQYNTIRPLWYLGASSPDPTQCCNAPTGIEVYTGTLIPQWTNSLFMCNLKAGQQGGYGSGYMYRFYLNAERTGLTSADGFSRLPAVDCTMDIETGTDGALYYFTYQGALKRIAPNGQPLGTNTPTPTATSTPTNCPCTSTATQTQPRASATATATVATCDVTFQDVSQDNAFYPYITCLACKQIIGGYPCGSPGEPCGGSGDPYYRPGANITRGQISKIVSEAAGFNDEPGEQIYEDVEPGSPFYAWINRLSRRGYMSGYACGGDGEPCEAGDRPYFRPGNNATRGQLTKIVANAAEFDWEVSGQSYNDVPESSDPSSFYPYIERLTERNVIGGYACGEPGPNSGPCDAENRPYFRPANLVTRGQAAKIVGDTFYPGCQRAVDIRNFSYKPVTTVVEVGTTVRWTNYDLDYHTVTSDDGGPLDSPNIQQNETWSYTFNTPGDYNYYCRPHPYMQGKVVVTP